MSAQGRLSQHVEKKENNWAVGSKKKLKATVEHRMKRIFVGILDLLDKERLEGRMSNEDFAKMRGKILNSGNDQVRHIKKEIDDKYNVEFIPYHVDFKIIPA